MKMMEQTGRLPVLALGYVKSTKVILGLPETAGLHFLLRPHDTILLLITAVHTEIRPLDRRAFYGVYLREMLFLDG